jgi:predicted acetylornithine/succinylornithine family transaminase
MTENVTANEQRVMDTFARIPVTFVRGEGMELFDSSGKRYYDFLSGIGTVGLGHSHPDVASAISEQVHKLTHVSNFFYVEHRAELADKLVELFGSSAKVFFTNSGTEAVEGALKLARKWGYLHKPAAHTIVTTLGSFHGRTYGALSATGQPERAAAFAPLLPGFTHVPFNDCAALEATLGDDTVAFMLEVIQGESGVWPATQEYLDTAVTLCRQHDILLIIDEVQTGIYRTGAPFAFQHYRVKPDIITSAKGLGNGYPIGAVIARDEVSAAFSVGDHGTTFGGGPVGCAAARATLRAYDEFSAEGRSITRHVQEVGEYAAEKLREMPFFVEVRGKGLMIGATLAPSVPCNAMQLRDALCGAGFIVNAPGERNIRLLPPLVGTNMHMDLLVDAIYAIMGVSRKDCR